MTDTPEAIQAPLFDAVLVHGYWLSQKGGEAPVMLSLRSHLEDRAGLEFHDGGRGAGKIVLTAGHIWGPEYPSVAEGMRSELIRKFKVPEDDIIVKTTFVNAEGEAQEVKSTDNEVEAFLQLSAERGWTRLADIAARVHNKNILPGIKANIPRLYRRRGRAVTYEAAEDIILRSDYHPRVKSKLRRLRWSRFETSFRFYEGVKRAILTIRPDYGALSNQAAVERSVKGDLGLPRIASRFPIDKYSL